ncbi:hypothetical protein [Paenibacillus taichungensis]|uniref:hypothetical protein n=1 Tax=Paenibacillus taichungensis TaxID=484184 RepID=UPI003D9A6B64
MDWLVEIGFVLLFLIVVIWLIVRDEPKRHSAKKGRHRVRRTNGYTDSSPAYPVITTNDDSNTQHSKHTHDHKHHDGDSFSESNHHHSNDSGSSNDSGGDSGGGDSGGGGD